jgi:hypothetical protein
MGGAGKYIGTGVGAVIGGVGGAYAGGPMGAMAGASLGASLGGMAGGAIDGGPSLPTVPKAPDPADDAVRNARLMERRKQLGLQGRMSTFLTTAQGDQAPAKASTQQTLLGG